MSDVTPITPAREANPWAATLAGLESRLSASAPQWLLDLRRAGFAGFRATGIPTTSQEDWRFTPLAPLTRLPFKPLQDAPASLPTREQLDRLPLASMPGNCLVLVDGQFVPGLSKIDELPQGTQITSLKEAITNRPGSVSKWIGKLAARAGNPFASLNQALFTDGAFIEIPDGVTLQNPIRIFHIQTAPFSGAAAFYRNLIIAGKSSHSRIIEHYSGIGTQPTVTNTVTEIHAAEDSDLEVVKFQDESTDSIHLAGIHCDFARASRVRYHSISLGARIARNDIRTRLSGPGLECVLNGLYLTRGEQLADHHMIVEHVEPHCASHEYFNGILDDRSRGVFHGRIYVHPEAQKTDAKQTNKNVLLSDEAGVDTKPQLEIYADDVKCTHGATIGQLNEESIFYLRARGIGLDRARRMLIHAFAGEIIERIQCAPAREAIDKIVWDRLEENPHVRAGHPA